MTKKKKLTRGDGWELLSPNDGPPPQETSLPPEEQKATLSLDRRPGGRDMTLIAGLVLEKSVLKDLARDLKNACGSGGTVKKGVIEIQGDHRDTIRAWLAKHGWGLA